MIYNLVCPYCHAQSQYNAPAEGWLEGDCLQCKKPFRTLLATIRSKRSRGSKKYNSRNFDVRVKHNGREEMLSFGVADHGDFELRSSDTAAFHYIKDKLHVVQNFNINQYKVVSQPPLGWIAWAFLGVLATAGFVYLLSRV
jgi:hypothetical protein